ncbi:arsenic transporter [Mucilaginibacter phyllosphaerae]|uniref:Arsenic transporter n=1 Tax=Mucilaginibacter phyllosphaerae TaxID=1812349 RepID=A0A4Y8ACR0_9SPHI|nr:arsenic transporter [Mucilaginibacter phyllosphaerae]MBB3969494.1 arsenical pump membrane protein [Mucilaginibacter phyllosphaerae]TEW65728.1 arsenic transporter [Mucilaginibacter phyllosphaerae]GGH08963.1 arsenic transporter [Mucilaginibacter phyllosphaerae]
MTNIFIWIISFLAIAGVIIRPFKVSEAIWAVTGAVILILFGLITFNDGLTGVAKGTDVYLFLTGMMLLAETAREEKLFDWLAAHATRMAKGSPKRLFLLIYLVGVVVTAFLSNDATAVVLTPAVAAAVKAAKVDKPLPYLFICAFIANAASFVLPISNPANLVIYGDHMPTLLAWLSHFLIPSVVSVAATYFLLFATQRHDLTEKIETNITLPKLSAGGKTAMIGIGATAIILLVSSALNIQLGLPTAITGVLTSAIVILSARKNPWTVIKGVSWAVLPLVAGLFVIVEGLNKTGLTERLTAILQHSAATNVNAAAWFSGLSTAFACNLMNNLPAGLIAGNVIQAGHVPDMVKSATLIGIDLGPNLSMTGSLATILWLVALRREGLEVSAWQFLKLGAIVMTGAHILVLLVL